MVDKQNTNQLDKMETQLLRSLRGMGNGLVAEFIVGVGLATYGAFNPDLEATQQSLTHYSFLGLHILIALTLLIGSTIILVLAHKTQQPSWKRDARVGFVAIVVATIGGLMIVLTKQENAGIFIMSLGFIVALVNYGRWYFTLKSG